MRERTRNLLAALASALAAAVLLAMLAAPAAAQLASPVRAVFLREYSKANYTMNQGEILVFENDDPFLSHGLAGPSILAPTIPPRSTSLVRRAPFLGPGTYPFGDPKNPGMVSSLTVTSAGTPLPPDAVAPKSALKIVSNGRQVAKGGKVKVRVAPNEVADVVITARVGKLVLGTVARAFPIPAGGALKIVLAPETRAQLGSRFRLEVSGRVTDSAGNATKLAKARTLTAPR